MAKYRIVEKLRNGEPYGYCIQEWVENPVPWWLFQEKYFWDEMFYPLFLSLEDAEKEVKALMQPKDVMSRRVVKEYG
jgi:hypothetical protein